MALTLALAMFAGNTMAQQEGGAAQGAEAQSMSPAMQKSMDPNVWAKLMTQMMQSPHPIGTCGGCHTPADVARYQQQFGPMLGMMQPAMGMMNPSMWANMAAPGMAMMNPAMGMMAPMMNPAMAMMNPAMAMMNPAMAMMNPAMAMMNPAMAMMNPAMGMMNPAMGAMGVNPMLMMGPMMAPMMGMMAPGANPMNMMQQMPGMAGQAPGMMQQMPGMAGQAPGHMQGMAGQMMDPKQYEKFYNAWQDMMKQFMPQAAQEGAPPVQ